MIIDPVKLLDGLLFGAALSAVDRVVLAAVARICWWAGADRGATVGQAAIAKMVDLHERTVRASIKRLILGGWVHREARNGARGRITDLLMLTDRAHALVSWAPEPCRVPAVLRPGLARCRAPIAVEPLRLAVGAELSASPSLDPRPEVASPPPPPAGPERGLEVRHVAPVARAARAVRDPGPQRRHGARVESLPLPFAAPPAPCPGARERGAAAPPPLGPRAGADEASGEHRGDGARAPEAPGGHVCDVDRGAGSVQYANAESPGVARIADVGDWREASAAGASRGGKPVSTTGFSVGARLDLVSGGADADQSPDRAPNVASAAAPASGKTKRRLTSEERAVRDAAEAERKKKSAEARAAKRAGEDMPLLPDVQRAWREAVAVRRGCAVVEVTITGRAISAARGYLGALFRQVAPGRPLTDSDREKVLTSARTLFARALATERPGFPLGLELVCSAPDRYQGAAPEAPRRGPICQQRANTITEEQRKARLYVVPDDYEPPPIGGVREK